MHASREWSSVCTLLIGAGTSRSISPVWRYEEWKYRHAASLIRCWHLWWHRPHQLSNQNLHPHLHLHCATREGRNLETVSVPPKGKSERGVPPKICFIKIQAPFIMALSPLWQLIDWCNGFYRVFISLLQQWIDTTSLHAWENMRSAAGCLTLYCVPKQSLMSHVAKTTPVLHCQTGWLACWWFK